jgi:hypothetical protein
VILKLDTKWTVSKTIEYYQTSNSNTTQFNNDALQHQNKGKEEINRVKMFGLHE